MFPVSKLCLWYFKVLGAMVALWWKRTNVSQAQNFAITIRRILSLVLLTSRQRFVGRLDQIWWATFVDFCCDTSLERSLESHVLGHCMKQRGHVPSSLYSGKSMNPCYIFHHTSSLHALFLPICPLHCFISGVIVNVLTAMCLRGQHGTAPSCLWIIFCTRSIRITSSPSFTSPACLLCVAFWALLCICVRPGRMNVTKLVMEGKVIVIERSSQACWVHTKQTISGQHPVRWQDTSLVFSSICHSWFFFI